ncbi:MAG: DNA-protecting protein DprA [Chlorobi bacterium]|nr:DNA-protecting protein DprA [Chlorobiota bacterium]
MSQSLAYKIALSLIPGIGGVLARNLVAYVGSVEGVFHESVKNLIKIPGIGEVNAKKIRRGEVLDRAGKEARYVLENNISTYFYIDKNYPRRLLNCADSPVMLYAKGEINFETERVISIVGTRNATDYGRSLCDDLIRSFSEREYDILVVSGLAYGIDIQAHKSSINYNLPTVGVLGHGLDLLYPAVHKSVARKMLVNGGLVTDFPSNTKIDPPNFLRRNRIIAGLADATIVVESGKKGGALVTADIASSYNRDVFAFPGKVSDAYSKGCNRLIRNNVAALIESIEDLEYIMGWENTLGKTDAVQQQLFVELTPEQSLIHGILKEKGEAFIDQVCSEAKLPMSRVSAILLNLEFKNVVISLPGKMYKLR